MCLMKGRKLESRFYSSLSLFLMHRSNDNINNHNLNNLHWDYFEYVLVYYRHYYYYYYYYYYCYYYYYYYYLLLYFSAAIGG